MESAGHAKRALWLQLGPKTSHAAPAMN